MSLKVAFVPEIDAASRARHTRVCCSGPFAVTEVIMLSRHIGAVYWRPNLLALHSGDRLGVPSSCADRYLARHCSVVSAGGLALQA